MACQRCKSERVVDISGKTSDMCSVQLGEKEINDYVPSDMGIGGGDYIRFNLCLDCGQVQGAFPIAETQLESEEDPYEPKEEEDE